MEKKIDVFTFMPLYLHLYIYIYVCVYNNNKLKANGHYFKKLRATFRNNILGENNKIINVINNFLCFT